MAELNKPKSYGSGSGTVHGYAVEIRSTYTDPEQHPWGFIVDKEWRRVPARIVRCDRPDHANHYKSGELGGVPVWNYNHEIDHLDLVNFEAAYAFACLAMAHKWSALCLEARIVEVEIQYSYTATEKAVGESISLSGMKRKYPMKPREEAALPEPSKERA